MKKNKKLLIGIGIVAVVVFVFFVIYKKVQIDKDDKSLLVGVLLPLTGESASYGVECRSGIEFAVAERSIPIKLFVEDSKGNPQTAVTSIRKLIATYKVDAIIGDMFSNTTLVIAPIAQKAGITLLTPSASDERIVATGDKIFCIYPSADSEGRSMANFVNAEISTTPVVIKQNVDIFNSIANGYIRALHSRFGVAVKVEDLPKGFAEYKSLASKVSSVKPSSIYIAAYRDEVATMICALRQLGLTVPIFSQSTLLDDKLFEKYPHQLYGVVFSGPAFSRDSDNITIKSFRERYKGKFGKEPSVWVAYGYDALGFIANAAEVASIEKMTIAKAMAESTLDGATGKTKLRVDRSSDKEMIFYTISNREFKIIH